MARKSNSAKVQLLTEMAENTDLSGVSAEQKVNIPQVGDPTLASAGSDQPTIGEEISAMLIMSGAQARWNWNFWLVHNHHGKRVHVAANATFDDWRAALNDLVGNSFG